MTKKSTSISTIAGDFKNVVELKVFCEKLYSDMERLLKENQLLRAQVDAFTNNKLVVHPMFGNAPIADEEVICMHQIERIKEIAMSRDLSLDEVKKLDLLHKNLRLIRGEATSNLGKMKDVTGSIPTNTLIEIAAASEPTKDN